MAPTGISWHRNCHFTSADTGKPWELQHPAGMGEKLEKSNFLPNSGWFLSPGHSGLSWLQDKTPVEYLLSIPSCHPWEKCDCSNKLTEKAALPPPRGWLNTDKMLKKVVKLLWTHQKNGIFVNNKLCRGKCFYCLCLELLKWPDLKAQSIPCRRDTPEEGIWGGWGHKILIQGINELLLSGQGIILRKTK